VKLKEAHQAEFPVIDSAEQIVFLEEFVFPQKCSIVHRLRRLHLVSYPGKVLLKAENGRERKWRERSSGRGEREGEGERDPHTLFKIQFSYSNRESVGRQSV